jgi:predicted RNA methylase
MRNLQRYLQDVANARRQELLPYMFHVTGARVQSGPFKGIMIIPQYMWGDGDTAAKLLGVYEDELHNFIESAIAQKPDIVINVGCAEGYYSVGLASRLPATTVIAVDVDGRSANIVKNTAQANQLKNLSAITHLVDHKWLEQQCQDKHNPLLVFDCEGAELELLDSTKITALEKCSLLVECHDCMNPVITKTLVSRFEHTHNIEQVSQTTKDSYQFEFLQNLSDCDKWALVHEGRPSTMSWLYMVPKL